MDYNSYLTSNVYQLSSEPLTKEEYNTFFDKVNKLFFIIEQNIENFKNNKNFELMQIHFKKAIEYVENNKDSYRISGEIIHAHLNYASELKNL
jgi:hypothetical protein